MAISNSLRSFIKSSAIFTAASIFVNLLGYAFHVFAGRNLGPASYSDITTILAYATILTVPVTVASVLIIKRSGSHHDKDLYLSSLLKYFDSLTKMYPTLLGVYLGLGVIGFINHLSFTSVLIMPAFVITFVFAQLYVILLQADKLFTTLSVTIMVAGILKLGGAMLTPFFPYATPILLLLIVSNITQIALARRYLLGHLPKNARILQESPFSLGDNSLRITFVSILGLVLFNNMDIVLAKQFLPASEAGIYGVWSLFAKAISFSFIPLSSVALVFFADRKEGHNPAHILFPSLAFLSMSGIVAYFGFKFLAGFMVTTLMGEKFSPLIPLLPLAAIFGTIYSLIYLVNNYYLSEGSYLAMIPIIITTVILVVLAIFGNTFTIFTQLITLCAGLSLLLYPMTIYLRTRRASFQRSH